MHDHLHTLLTPGSDYSLEQAMKMIKGGSSRKIGIELRVHWLVWQTGFHDRFVGNESEFHNFAKYIEENPHNRGLVETPELDPWSSANGPFVLDPSRFDELQGLKPSESSNTLSRPEPRPTNPKVREFF
jgi:Transposase IS200 like